VTPISFIKLAQIKKGSSAGKTLPAHKEIPFCADKKAMEGNTTMLRHAKPATKIAAIYIFFLLSIKSMLNDIHMDFIYTNYTELYQILLCHILL
jgi:hypothetical protein